MKSLHIEMSSGIAGDMLLAALIDCSKNPDQIKSYLLGELSKLNLKGQTISLDVSSVFRKGISAKYARFHTPEDDWFKTSDHDHSHGQSGDHDHGHSHGNDGDHHHGHSDHNHHHHGEHTHSHEHSHDSHDHEHSGDHHHHHDKHTHSHGHSHDHGGNHQHRTFSTIRKLIDESPFSKQVKETTLKCFTLLAEAEGSVHGKPMDEVHFHEVGSLDAILEIFSVALLLEKLNIKNITSSPLVLGNGYVNCAHGKMPVPVPAVMAMIEKKNPPFHQLDQQTGELTTPTGAAILLSIVHSFQKKVFNASTIQLGYGAGKRDHALLANFVRVWLLEEKKDSTTTEENNSATTDDTVCSITCNIDDMSGEAIARSVNELLAQGAVDVHLSAITMKKGRPAVKMEMLTKPQDAKRLGLYLLSNTSTLGYRYQLINRHILHREIISVEVKGELLKVKVAKNPDGDWKIKIEDSSLIELKEKLISNGLISNGNAASELEMYQQKAVEKTREILKKRKT